MLSKFSRFLVNRSLVKQSVRSFGAKADHHDSHHHEADHHDGHHHEADHHDHHHHEVLAPGYQGGWTPDYDWRRDPCLEWGYGGHHHHARYDWRDDPKHNPDLYIDARDVGANQIEFTSFPYTGTHDSTWWFPQFPASYKSTDLAANLVPENKQSDILFNNLRSAYWTPEDDVAHEYDYESEDLDFQCETFKMMHFRKKGGLSQWVIAGFLPIIYFYFEWVYQHFPDEDFFRIPHPPPLNYPDTEDTDDTDTVKDYNSKEGRYLRDSGIVDDIWFDIVDGVKVYRRFAGVNQPLPDL